ncbi:MAG: hypothetical protein PVJ67_00705 [Candidatus Pacearchaeota archaeon]|jgi:hypothetical protein
MEIIPYEELSPEEKLYADLAEAFENQKREPKIARIICAPFESMEPGMQPPANQIKERLRKARNFGAEIHPYSKMNPSKLRKYFTVLQNFYRDKLNQ